MRTHFPGALHKVRSAARFPFRVVGVWMPDEWRVSASSRRRLREWESRDRFVVRHSFLKEGARLVNRSKVPVQTHPSWGPDECELVAESAEPEDPAPELPPIRPDGQGVQLRGGIQEPRPGCRDQGSACLDDDVAGLVASRLWPLWGALHSYGLAQRRYVPHRRRPRRGRRRYATFRAP